MGWGTALKVAYKVASTTAKAAYNTYKAVNYVKDRVVEAAVATKDAAVAAVEYGVDAAKLGAIKAREAQAAFQHGRKNLSQCKAGSPVEVCPHKIAECAELADARNKAILSEDTYNTSPTQADKDKLLAETGYRRLDPSKDAKELRNQLGIRNPKELLAPDGTDFRANVYAKGVAPNVDMWLDTGAPRPGQTGSRTLFKAPVATAIHMIAPSAWPVSPMPMPRRTDMACLSPAIR